MENAVKKRAVIQQKSLFAPDAGRAFDYTVEHVASPAAYDGVLAFHKYWGKKPVEPLAFLIERLTQPGDLVIDPFSGSGVTGFAAVGLKRRYLGVDVNPVACRLSSLVLDPPELKEFKFAFEKVASVAKCEINQTYLTRSSMDPATHYLWDSDRMKEIWLVSGRNRLTIEPTEQDRELFESYECYRPGFRSPNFFKNSRINADPSLTWNDLFTGRALRNIDLLLATIRDSHSEAKMALELCVTAALGQMSKMVFAITGRGKTTGVRSKKIEVGSWVIGFWRPPLHFEINVWNCFERKVQKLQAGINSVQSRAIPGSIEDLLDRRADFSIVTADAVRMLSSLPDGSADMILTDPPHSDRAPYLELSELWNSVLGMQPEYCDEIVVSNAKERRKNLGDYNARMKQLTEVAVKKLSQKGCLAIQFNARDHLSWEFLRNLEVTLAGTGISFRGTFPLRYSANSVVQDNREGALTTDYVLMFGPNDAATDAFSFLPGWTSDYPVNLKEEKCL
jgi:16S rRNA G966 N2-methylase RsmD